MAGRSEGQALNPEAVEDDELYQFLLQLRTEVDTVRNNQIPRTAIADLDSTATLTEVITTVNSILARLRTAGIVD